MSIKFVALALVLASGIATTLDARSCSSCPGKNSSCKKGSCHDKSCSDNDCRGCKKGCKTC